MGKLFCALLIGAAGIVFETSVIGQEMEDREPRVKVEAEELPSAYGAPPDLSHGRISTLTKSYVLSPFNVELEAGYEGDILRHGLPAHVFNQEIEIGLPARFTVGLENQIEHFAGATRDRSLGLETRYALADWDRLLFNPAVLAEYRFGLANGVHDSGELALLISHSFPHLVEWAMNLFVDQDFGGKESTNFGFAQSLEVPVLLSEEKLEIGLEMQYRSGGEPIIPQLTSKGVVIGPTLAWRPTRNLRFDLSPLLGCSDHTPAVQVFAIVSLSFGGAGAGDAETPASARGR